MTAEQPLHVIFGAGQVGPPLARALAAAGQRVRLVRRSASMTNLDSVQFMQADALDPASVAEAVRGAAVVYHCMNPPYSAAIWASELPRMQANLIAGAGKAGARLVVLDNLYSLGRNASRPMNEATPADPCSRKGEIRGQLAESLAEAVKRGDVRAVTGRAADFYGPGGGQTQFAERFWPGVFAGKKVSVFVNPEVPHTYHYIPDVAGGLALLGQDDTADGLFMLPCQPAVTTRELIGRFSTALSRPITISRVAPLFMKLLGLGMPIVREVNEMAYQWEAPFVVDDTKFRERYGAKVTPVDVAAKATTDWAIATWGGAAQKAA